MKPRVSKQAEKLFVEASEAREAAYRRALRDASLWRAQFVIFASAGLKVAALALVVGAACLAGGSDVATAMLVGIIVAGMILPFNPGQVFWRFLASEKADQAFNDYVQQHRR